MKKETALEWLHMKLDVYFELFPSEWQKLNQIIDEAIAMEKKQTEENMAHAITFGWELSHYHRDKEPEKLLQMQKDFITSVIKGGYK
jgi:hypothetical protein